MNAYDNKVKWCPVCDQGWVEIVKDSSKQQLYLYCNECETEWINPKEIRKDNGTQDSFQTCEKVTPDEIEKKGWNKFLMIA
jgi:formate dehydrogenase maturation protein FdhE